MDTDKTSRPWEELLQLIAEGLRSGRLRVEPEYDGNQHIIAFHVVPARPDPRRSTPDRYRKTRPL